MTPKLKDCYQYTDDTRYYDAIELYHSKFGHLYIIRDEKDHIFEGNVYDAYPFKLEIPEVGEKQQTISITLANVLPEVTDKINQAALLPTESIKCTYRVFIEGETGSQIHPITLYITSVQVSDTQITCKANRTDLFARKFPTGKDSIYDQSFPGLFV